MSIMGMREWFRNNRVVMLVVFVLLLVGLLVSYGRFGSTSGYSAADYEKMLTEAREAYAANPESPDTVYNLFQVLASYSAFLTNDPDKQEQARELDDEALQYYDKYYGLLADEAKAAYQAEPNYTNAATMASYLNSRAGAQSMLGMDSDAMQTEATSWMVLAMGHRIDELNAELAENANDPEILADLAQATGALGYYKHEQDENFALTESYQQAQQLFLQAAANCGDDVEPLTKAEYYMNAGAYAEELEDSAAAEQHYKEAVNTMPGSYNVNMNYASFLQREERYDEGLQFYLQTIAAFPPDGEPTIKAYYYLGAANCADSLEDKAGAEEYYQTAVSLAPNDYDVNINYVSFLLNDSRYDEAIKLLQDYQATLDKNSEDYSSLQQDIEYIQTMKELAENPEAALGNGSDAEDGAGEGQAQ